jgi:predicted ATP-dependent serine protease
MSDLESCKHCGADLEEGRFQCPKCRRFNMTPAEADGTPLVKSLSEVDDLERVRLTRKEFWAPLLGGGLVQSQLLLIGGGAGSGKSTWVVQVLASIARETGKRGLLIHTEESEKEVKARVKRLGYDSEHFAIPLEPQDEGLACLEEPEDYAIVIVDSLQDLVGEDPNEAVRALGVLKEYAMATDTPVIAVNHVNKDEDMAGLNRLKHKVDTTMLIIGDEDSPERVMTVTKNRFGQSHKRMILIMNGENDRYPGLLKPKNIPGKGKNLSLVKKS